MLASDTFINATPYNPAFAESYLLVKDFWNIPEYAALLEPQMEYLNLAISGQMDPQEALDEIAIEQQEILNDAYPDGPPGGSAVTGSGGEVAAPAGDVESNGAVGLPGSRCEAPGRVEQPV